MSLKVVSFDENDRSLNFSHPFLTSVVYKFAHLICSVGTGSKLPSSRGCKFIYCMTGGESNQAAWADKQNQALQDGQRNKNASRTHSLPTS